MSDQYVLTIREQAGATPGGGGGWWTWGTSIVDQVKQQTAELVETALHSELAEATKRDLGVFVSTVQEESTKTVAVTSASLATKIQKDMLPTEAGIGSEVVHLLNNLSQTLTVSEDKKDRQNRPQTPSLASVPFTRRQQFLNQLHSTPTPYLSEPDDIDDFHTWGETFDVDVHTPDIAQLLQEVPQLKSLQTNLVPRVVSYVDFWKRYFYQVHVFDKEETERQSIKQKAQERLLEQVSADDDLGWGDDIEDGEGEVATDTAQDSVEGQQDIAGGSTPDIALDTAGADDSPALRDSDAGAEVAAMPGVRDENEEEEDLLGLGDDETLPTAAASEVTGEKKAAGSQPHSEESDDSWLLDSDCETAAESAKPSANSTAATTKPREPSITEDSEDWDEWS